MALKLWVLLALVYVAECHIIKSVKEVLPAEGMVVEVIIKPNSDQVSLEDSGKRISRKTHDVVIPPELQVQDKVKNSGPEIENRFGIRSGVCPTGYVRRGGFCFPDDYD